MKIEKLELNSDQDLMIIKRPTQKEMMDKINELIDAFNKLNTKENEKSY